MLRNMLGPIFNFNLDQFLTLEFSFFFFCFGGGGGCWNLYFYCVSAKMQHWKKHKKKKCTICEHTCANCFCQNVYFSAFFIFVVFELHVFWEMFLIGSQKSSNKIWKQQK